MLRPRDQMLSGVVLEKQDGGRSIARTGKLQSVFLGFQASDRLCRSPQTLDRCAYGRFLHIEPLGDPCYAWIEERLAETFRGWTVLVTLYRNRRLSETGTFWGNYFGFRPTSETLTARLFQLGERATRIRERQSPRFYFSRHGAEKGLRSWNHGGCGVYVVKEVRLAEGKWWKCAVLRIRPKNRIKVPWVQLVESGLQNLYIIGPSHFNYATATLSDNSYLTLEFW